MKKAQMEQAISVNEKLKIASAAKVKAMSILEEPDFGVSLVCEKGGLELSAKDHTGLVENIKKDIREYFNAEVTRLQDAFEAL